MRQTSLHIISLLAGLCLCACSTTRTVPEGDRLYTGADVKWEGKKPKDYGTLKAALDASVRPKPNRRFLGMPIRLWLYNLGNEPKGKGLNYLFRRKWGEPPVLLSQVKRDYTSEVLREYLVDNGYFQSEVSSAIKNKGRKKASAAYTATPNLRYLIEQVVYETDSSQLGRTIAGIKRDESLMYMEPYRLDSIKAERERIHRYLKDRGYYYFTADHLLAEVDSTHNGKVHIFIRVKDDISPLARKPYFIRRVTLYPTYSLDADSSSRMGEEVTLYRNFGVVDPEKKFRPRIFRRSVFLRPDSLYRLSNHDITLQRLINLGVFKFVKGQFRPTFGRDTRDTTRFRRSRTDTARIAMAVDSSRLPLDSSTAASRRRFYTDTTGVAKDTGQLDASFYLTPYPQYSLQAELRGTSKSNGFVGSEVKVTQRNRNWQRAANLLEISASGGMEWQTGGNLASNNSYSLKGEVALTLPRFLVPFRAFNIRTPYVPRTRISLSYELFSRQNLYNLNAYTAQWQYLWRQTRYLEHAWAPLSVTFVRPSSTTPAYDSILKVDPVQRRSIEKQFILGGFYNITYNNQAPNRVHSVYFSGDVDVSGNLAGLVIPKGDSSKNIFGSPFAQYVRLGADFRHYWQYSRGMTWVNRLFFGYGIPYGNSRTLPFIKQYFTGGSSSLRGFRARTLGPGSYHDTTSRFLANEAGDVKLEFNSELRVHLVSMINAAAFIDAGNIWLQKSDTSRPGGQFSSHFLKEIAVNAGVGLRIDASIVVVRLDLAFPLRKPWLPENERWVIKDIRFGDPDWRRENLILNIAIGYPF
ncbi:BamA/TamA family outer membrane protein [uncultured Chitinophaga sp.]|uniref:translocation and assembly module lipoprotein TamL n=1 Tax=uncultured Chitinophaga sp. TaxID=339340 RepID=UPI002619B5D5|nr:BamA/TamA family outer membrane protein [uncultured Chitinophaga sp.]